MSCKKTFLAISFLAVFALGLLPNVSIAASYGSALLLPATIDIVRANKLYDIQCVPTEYESTTYYSTYYLTGYDEKGSVVKKLSSNSFIVKPCKCPNCKMMIKSTSLPAVPSKYKWKFSYQSKDRGVIEGNFFRIVNDEPIKITSPKFGEKLYSNQTYKIKWTQAGLQDTYNHILLVLEAYDKNKTRTDYPLETLVSLKRESPSQESFDIDLSGLALNANTAYYKIYAKRVRNDRPVLDTMPVVETRSPAFSILPAPVCSPSPCIKLVYKTGCKLSSVKKESTCEIKWASRGVKNVALWADKYQTLPDGVKLVYPSFISGDVVNAADGVYQWKIGSDMEPGSYKIQVQQYDSGVANPAIVESDDYFTITDARTGFGGFLQKATAAIAQSISKAIEGDVEAEPEKVEIPVDGSQLKPGMRGTFSHSIQGLGNFGVTARMDSDGKLRIEDVTVLANDIIQPLSTFSSFCQNLQPEVREYLQQRIMWEIGQGRIQGSTIDLRETARQWTRIGKAAGSEVVGRLSVKKSKKVNIFLLVQEDKEGKKKYSIGPEPVTITTEEPGPHDKTKCPFTIACKAGQSEYNLVPGQQTFVSFYAGTSPAEANLLPARLKYHWTGCNPQNTAGLCQKTVSSPGIVNASVYADIYYPTAARKKFLGIVPGQGQAQGEVQTGVRTDNTANCSAVVNLSLTEPQPQPTKESTKVQATPTEKLTSVPTVKIEREAEAATLTNSVQIKTDDPLASGSSGRGGYVVLDGKGDEARFEVEIPSAGTYYIWVKTIAPNTGSDSFFLTLSPGVDKVAPLSVGSDWKWNKLWYWQSAWRISEYRASQGPNALLLKWREGAVKLDKIVITNDKNYSPVVTPASTTLQGIQKQLANVSSAVSVLMAKLFGK